MEGNARPRFTPRRKAELWEQRRKVLTRVKFQQPLRDLESFDT